MTPAVRASSILGTPLYFPPEYIIAKHEQELAGSQRRHQHKRESSVKSRQASNAEKLDATGLDVWGIGVITWIMTTGTHPFGNDDGPRMPSLDPSLSAYVHGADDNFESSSSPEISTLEAAIQRRSFDRRVVSGDVRPICPCAHSVVALTISGLCSTIPTRRSSRTIRRRPPSSPPSFIRRPRIASVSPGRLSSSG